MSAATGAFQWEHWAGLTFPGCKQVVGRILLEKLFNVSGTNCLLSGSFGSVFIMKIGTAGYREVPCPVGNL